MIKLFLTFLMIAFNVGAQAQNHGVYKFSITRIIDGDTVGIEANFLPPPLKPELLLRIYGVDTPEKGKRAKCAKENAMSEIASEFTRLQIHRAKERLIVIIDWDKYGGRVLGDVVLDGKSLRQELIKNGYAREYFGDAKKSWCS